MPWLVEVGVQAAPTRKAPSLLTPPSVFLERALEAPPSQGWICKWTWARWPRGVVLLPVLVLLGPMLGNTMVSALAPLLRAAVLLSILL